jgi:hypothetical protein
LIVARFQLAPYSWCGYEPRGPSPRRWKPPTYRKSIDNRTFGCPWTESRSHRRSPGTCYFLLCLIETIYLIVVCIDWSAAWYSQGQGSLRINLRGFLLYYIAFQNLYATQHMHYDHAHDMQKQLSCDRIKTSSIFTTPHHI